MTLKKDYVSQLVEANFREEKSDWRIERFLPFQFPVHKFNCSLFICTFNFAWYIYIYIFYHRIIDLFELEGILNDLDQLPCDDQDHYQLDQVVQSPIQTNLEDLQGPGFYHLSGQLVPVLYYLYCKIFFSL